MNANPLWAPPSAEAQLVAAVGAMLLMALSAAALTFAPLALPAAYSVAQQGLNEAASQGLPQAWITRLGFLTFGQAVLWLAAAFQHRWARIVWWPHALFGVFMMATATFSARPWLPGVATDEFEAGLHTFVFTAAAVVFAIGTAARAMQRSRERETGSLFDACAAACCMLALLAASLLPDGAGYVQRALFAVAYLWYGREAVSALRRREL
jgi:hypothetical protein